jgi:hypothetical protein
MLDLGPLAGRAGRAGLRMPSTVVGQSARYSAERTRLQDAKYLLYVVDNQVYRIATVS